MTSPTSANPTDRSTHRSNRWRTAYVVLAAIVLAGVAVQVALAGLAAFDLPEMWRWHTRFVNVVETAALILLLVALIGRLRGLRWPAAALLLLIATQHGTAALGGVAGGVHALNALVLLMLGHLAVTRARRAAGRDHEPTGG